MKNSTQDIQWYEILQNQENSLILEKGFLERRNNLKKPSKKRFRDIMARKHSTVHVHYEQYIKVKQRLSNSTKP